MGRGKGFAGVQYKFTEHPEKTEKTRPAEVGPRAGQGSGGGGGKGPEVAGQGSGGSGGAGEWWGMGAEVAENERDPPACHPLPRASELLADLEAGASLRRKLLVAVYRSPREPQAEQEHQRLQRYALRRRARVLRRAVLGVQAPDVADADAVRVLSAAVRPGQFQRPSAEDRPVQAYHVVIPHVGKALRLVPPADILHRVRPALRRGRAVDNDLVNRPHGFGVLVGLALRVVPSVRPSCCRTYTVTPKILPA